MTPEERRRRSHDRGRIGSYEGGGREEENASVKRINNVTRVRVACLSERKSIM